MMRRSGFLGVAASVLLLVVLAGCGGDDGAEDAAGALPEVEANALLQSVTANQAAARKVYQGKRVRVVGTIASLGSDAGQHYILLGPLNGTHRVVCELYAEYGAQVRELSRGDRVSMSGVIRMNGRVILEGARLEE